MNTISALSLLLFTAIIGVLPHFSDPKQDMQQMPRQAHPMAMAHDRATPMLSMLGTLYAYSSTPDQTDADPYHTASGSWVADGTVANNCLPFGTRVRFPAVFPEKKFTVVDRMAARHGCSTFDIWHASTAEARQFGRQISVVEVYK